MYNSMITIQFLQLRRFGHYFLLIQPLSSICSVPPSTGQCFQLGEGRVVVYSALYVLSSRLTQMFVLVFRMVRLIRNAEVS
jgi:hypothetical protein